MNSVQSGLLLAGLSSLFFGFYMAPRKNSQLDNLSFLWIMGLSVAFLSTIFRFISRVPAFIQPSDIMLSGFSGVLWYFGSYGYSIGVQKIGLARSTPVKNLGPIVTTCYGVLLFQEFSFSDPISLFEVISGSALMSLAAILFGRTTAEEAINGGAAYNPSLSLAQKKVLFNQGIVWSLLAALCFSAYSVPMKWVFRHMRSEAEYGFHENIYPFLSAMGQGIGICAVITYMILQRPNLVPKVNNRADWGKAALGGCFWTIASVVSGLSLAKIPMSVTWPISNLSTLVSVALGVWLYREVHLNRHRQDFILGLVTCALGIFLLAAATSHGRV